MRERVTTIHGKEPIILVCPHGADDTNTDIITELAAKHLNCYAVINRGFERDDEVDVDNDRANCNRIDHIKEEVIFDEYLKPIQKFQQKISQKGQKTAGSAYNGIAYWYQPSSPCHIFHIHGCGNLVHKTAGEQVEVIVGYGLGAKKDSLSCNPENKDLFIKLWRNYATGGEVYTGAGGGKYAGRDSNNMNQYFRKHITDMSVQSMQLEFPFSMRDSASQATTTAMVLSLVLQDYLKADGSALADPVTEKFI